VKRARCLLLLLLALAWPAAAQEDDSLFEGELIEEAPEAQPAEGGSEATAASQQASEETFLVSPKLEWGGSFESRFTAEWGWDGYAGTWDDLIAPSAATLDSRVAADLFFDARPARDFRVFGKFKAAYAYDPATSDFLFDARIFELFSDFSWKDRVFFRVGKHTIQWGVGYFFSPADVLNLVSIDPKDPTAEREGPVSLKAQVPFGQHNAYLYLITNDILHPSEIGVAPKVELVIGGYELGLGGLYQKNLAPKGMVTVTGPLANIDLFGEAVVQYGSDRRYVRADGPYEVYRIEDRWLFSGSAGATYVNPDWNLLVCCQYFCNGQGYETFDATLAALAAAAIAAGDLSAADLLYTGRHYLAATVSWSKILDSDFALSLLYLANLADGSGMIQPSLSWTLLEHATLTVGAQLPYGVTGDEYTPAGPTPGFWIAASLGAGKF
jgi:hypothetical protein